MALSSVVWGIKWRSAHAAAKLRAYAALVSVSARWRFHARGRRHALPGRLVVSLTSYPPRFPVLAATLKSLLSQTVAPDEIVLWIAHEDAARLPPEVLALQAAGLSIRFTRDLRSYKKIIPALQEYPDAFIVTADDDLFYWPTWLEELVSAYRPEAREVICHRAHCIRLDDAGRPHPYETWDMEVRSPGRSRLLFPTTGAGALYAPNSLTADVTDPNLFMRYCPTADDVWLYWSALRQGMTFRKIGGYRPLVAWPGSQAHTLYSLNVGEMRGNDRQLAELERLFGPIGAFIAAPDAPPVRRSGSDASALGGRR